MLGSADFLMGRSGWPFLILWVGFLAPFRGAASPVSENPSPSVFGLFQDMWHWRTNESPEFATQVGINDNTAGRLDSFSKDRFMRKKEECENMLEKSSAIPREGLSDWDRINLKAFSGMMKEFIDNFKFLKFYTPMTSLEGPHLHLPHIVTSKMTLESYNDFQKLLSRYGRFPSQAEEFLEIMKENVRSGIMPHNISLEGILTQLSSLEVSVINSTFFSPFLHLPLTIPSNRRVTLRQQAMERISQDLYPSYHKLKDFLKQHYLRNTRPSPGVASLTGGGEYYLALLKYYTSTKLSPQEIHSLGISEIKRLTIEVNKMASSTRQNISLKEELSPLKEGDHFYKSGEELIKDFRVVFDKAKKIVRHLIEPFSEDDLSINTYNHEKLDRGRMTWYEAASLDGNRKATLYIDKKRVSQISKYELVPLSLSLSYPGQHLHTLYLRMNPSIPNFRKVLQPSRWSLIPAELSHNEAFAEGWALYSESLEEADQFYSQPMESFMRLNRQLMSSAKLVVDTGIHSLGWSIETASNYFLENTGLSEQRIKEEIRRIVTWPGQACAAKIGEVKLRELRQRAQNALGESFSIKKFHEILLQCTNPFILVEECISKYISDSIRVHVENSRQPLTEPTPTEDDEQMGSDGGQNSDTQDSTAARSAKNYNSFFTLHLGIFLLFYTIV